MTPHPAERLAQLTHSLGEAVAAGSIEEAVRLLGERGDVISEWAATGFAGAEDPGLQETLRRATGEARALRVELECLVEKAADAVVDLRARRRATARYREGP
jgi:hypothetical protein